ncbi:MAG TPA: hypothetical protein VI011_01535 [Asanoa sp.]
MPAGFGLLAVTATKERGCRITFDGKEVGKTGGDTLGARRVETIAD